MASNEERDVDFGKDPEAYERAVLAAQEEIYKHLQHLHDDGVLDLDAPARSVVDVLDREYPQPTADARASAARAGYWLVGDQGWCNHL